MDKDLRNAFRHEFKAARLYYRAGNKAAASHHLERAHILGQQALWPHLRTHWWMLKVGFRRGDGREIMGQVVRMGAAVLGWAVGWVPPGNTGGTDVPLLKAMPIPAEFAHFFEGHNANRHLRRRMAILGSVSLLAAGGFFVHGVWARAGEDLTVVTRFNGQCLPLAGYQGAEDIVVDREGGVTYAVGGDRRSFRSGGPGRAKIWALATNDGDSGPPVDIAPPSPAIFRSFGADLHIDVDGTRRLFVANRPDDGHTIEVFRVEGGRLLHERTLRSPLLRNPNDVVAIGPDRVLVTLDKDSEAGTLHELFEGILELPTGKVLLLGSDDSRIIATGLRMANGLALAPDGRTLYVAELVGRSIVLFDRNPVTNALARRRTVPVEMAPDNLTVAADGRVFAAGHPKLLSLATGYQRTEDRPSPSMVSIYDPSTDAVRTVFSSDGKEIAGSSVAVLEPSSGRLLIGSSFGPHILSCRLPGL